MPYRKTIACLADSIKFHPGRCVAGKEFVKGAGRQWIRPVSERDGGEIMPIMSRYADGSSLQLLDLVSIPFERAVPEGCQTENHLIVAGGEWRKEGRIGKKDLPKMEDNIGPLWESGGSSSSGLNDRILLANQPNHSLRLIRVTNLQLIVQVEGAAFGPGRRAVRAQFDHEGTSYLLKVTDPLTVEQYRLMKIGKYSVKNAYLCVSLGEPYKGYRYKLAAAVITPDRIPST